MKFLAATLLAMCTLVSGCAVVTVADAAVSTAVTVGAGAVKLTGAAVGAVVDVVTPGK